MHHNAAIGALDRSDDRLAVHWLQGAEVDDLDVDTFAGKNRRSFERLAGHPSIGHDGGIGARTGDVCNTQRHFEQILWAGALGAEQGLGLGVDHRVVIANGGHQETLGIVGVRRHDDLETRHVGQHRLEALAVLSSSRQTCASIGGDGQRQACLATEHVLELGCLVRDLVHGNHDEVHKHEVDDGPQASNSSADTKTDDCLFADRCIDGTQLAVLLLEATEAAEHTTASANIFASAKDVGVFGHDLMERLVDCA